MQDLQNPIGPPEFLAQFREVLRGFRWIMAYVVGFASAPWLLRFVFDVGPAWPSEKSRTCLYTSAVAFVVFAFAYMNFEKVARYKSRDLNKKCFLNLAIIFMFYVIITTVFVYDDFVGQTDPVVGGFILREDVATVVPSMMNRKEALEQTEYEPMNVWVEWTVQAIRSLIILSWLALFGFLSFYISILVLYERKRYLDSKNRLKSQ